MENTKQTTPKWQLWSASRNGPFGLEGQPNWMGQPDPLVTSALWSKEKILIPCPAQYRFWVLLVTAPPGWNCLELLFSFSWPPFTFLGTLSWCFHFKASSLLTHSIFWLLVSHLTCMTPATFLFTPENLGLGWKSCLRTDGTFWCGPQPASLVFILSVSSCSSGLGRGGDPPAWSLSSISQGFFGTGRHLVNNH